MKTNNTTEKYYDSYKPILIFIGIIVIIYGKNLGFAFSFLDDDLLIVNNANFFLNNSWTDVFGRDVFLNGLSAFYRPIQALMYYFIYNIDKGAPSGFFLFNIVIHIGTIISIFYLLLELKIERKYAFWVTIFYAINPLLVHSVSWIPSSGDLIMGFTITISFLYFLKAQNSNENKFTYIHLLFFGIALFTKESTILFPIIPLIYYYMTDKTNVYRKQLNCSIIGWIILIAIYLIARNYSVDMARASQTFSLSYIFENIFVIPELIFKFFAPMGLSPSPRITSYKVLIGTLILVCIIGIFYYKKDTKNKILILGLFWSIVLLIPTLAFKHQLSDQSYQYLEQRAYMPFIGLIPILAILLQKFKLLENKNYLYLLTAYITFLSLFSYVYSFNYKNPDKFYGRALKINPNDPMAYYNRGVARQRNNRIDEALQDYNKALEIRPEYHTVHNNRAIVFSLKGRFDLAIPEFTKAIQYNPNFADFYSNRGNAYSSIKDFKKALDDYNYAISLEPNKPSLYFYRAHIKLQLGLKDEACADAQQSADMGFTNAVEILNKYCR